MNKNILHISICQTINRKGGEKTTKRILYNMNYIWIKLFKKAASAFQKALTHHARPSVS